jgi:transcriptional regulator with XRE-family HTH domain
MGKIATVPHFLMIKYGDVIKKHRLEAHIPQKRFAQQLKTNPTYLSAVEHNKRAPSLDFLQRACELLGLPVEVLLWEAVSFDGVPPRHHRIFQLAKRLVSRYSKKG